MDVLAMLHDTMPHPAHWRDDYAAAAPTHSAIGGIVRIGVLVAALICIGGALAYTRMNAPTNDVIVQQTQSEPPSARMRVPPAVQPTPMPKAHPVSDASSPQSRADGPVPAPLVDPLQAPPAQTVDVDPRTPVVLTPVPEKVAY